MGARCYRGSAHPNVGRVAPPSSLPGNQDQHPSPRACNCEHLCCVFIYLCAVSKLCRKVSEKHESAGRGGMRGVKVHRVKHFGHSEQSNDIAHALSVGSGNPGKFPHKSMVVTVLLRLIPFCLIEGFLERLTSGSRGNLYVTRSGIARSYARSTFKAANTT